MTRRLALLLLLVMLISSGCWSRREMNDLGIVMTLGVDLTESGLLEVTLGIAQPAAAGGQPQGGGGGGSGAGGGEPRAVIIRTGKTLAEAIREAELIIPRRLTLQHIQVIVLGQRLAEHGLDTLLDYLLRSPEVRLSTRMMVLRGVPIREMLAQVPIVERLQAQVLRELASSRLGLVRNLREFLIARSSPHQAPVLPVVTMQGSFSTSPEDDRPTPELSGIALFRDDKLAAYMDAEQTRGFIWLIGSARDAVITAECPDQPGKYLSARVYESHRDVTPVMRGAQVGFRVKIKGTLHLTEMQCGIDLLDPARMREVQQVLRERIGDRVEEAIRIAQAVPADPFNFGDYVRARMPQVWGRLADRWPQAWANAPVEVEVSARAVHVTGAVKVPNWRPYPPVSR